MRYVKSIYLCVFLLFCFQHVLQAQTPVKVINSLDEKTYLDFVFIETSLQDSCYKGIVSTLYDGYLLSARLNGKNKMVVFRSGFKISDKFKDQQIGISIGASEYACRLFINGKILAQYGQYQKSVTSKLQFICEAQIPPSMLNYGDTINVVTLQVYPKFDEITAIDKVFVASYEIVDDYAFIRNFIRVNLIQAASIFTLILFIYFLFGFFLNKYRLDNKYLVFAVFCLFFALGYTNITLSANYANEFLLFKLSRIGLSGANLFLVLYTISFTKLLNTKKCIYIGLSIPVVIFQFIFAFQTDFGNLEKYFGLFASTINLPYLLFAFILSVISAIKSKKIDHYIYMAGFVVFFATVATDTINYTSGVVPYAWLICHGFLFFTIVTFFILAHEQSRIYTLSVERGMELEKNNDNLETIVKQRTAQIEQQNEELLAQADNLKESNAMLEEMNTEINQQKEELHSQTEYLMQANEEIIQQKQLVEKTHSEITDSIIYASRIQRAVLPDINSFKLFFQDSFIYHKPKNVVSGDFYFFKIIGDQICFAVADCTGHGVPGAFMSMLGISYLTDIVSRSEVTKASEVLEQLRNIIKLSLHQKGENYEQKDGMDVAFCVINQKTKMLQFSGANLPLYLFRNQELIEYKPIKNPIGIYLAEVPFENHIIEFLQNDVIYLFTDGFIDQTDSSGSKKFKKFRFNQMLQDIHQKTLSEQKQLIDDTYNNWLNGSTKQIDDILILAVKG